MNPTEQPPPYGQEVPLTQPILHEGSRQVSSEDSRPIADEVPQNGPQLSVNEVPLQPMPIKPRGYDVPQAVPVILTAPILIAKPTPCICPFCHADVITETQLKDSLNCGSWPAWVDVAICCCLGGLVPLCLVFTKEVVHRCPNCQHIIGEVERI